MRKKSCYRLLALFWLGNLVSLPLPAQMLTTFGEQPDWKQLDRYQAEQSKTEFVGRLNTIFAPHGAASPTIGISGNGADIVTELGNPRKGRYRLLFAQENQNPPAPMPSAAHSPHWRSADDIRADATPAQPLKGLRVAIDPGHIGGDWGFMERREWAFGGGPVFREGDFVLRVAEILAEDLRALGAQVSLVRDSATPVTDKRPQDFTALARERLSANGAEPSEAAINRESELLFYRTAEIRARAEKINNEIQPDIVLCLHVDAAAFPPDGSAELPHGSTLHVLVNGAYSAAELQYDDQRLDMLNKMLSGADAEEIALGDAIARQLAADTGLPPMSYSGSNAARVNDNPYLWARNLIANRIYRSPTVFIEAYTANREPFYSRYAMGEYEGTRDIDGQPRKNLWREYADSVRDALIAHYAPPK